MSVYTRVPGRNEPLDRWAESSLVRRFGRSPACGSRRITTARRAGSFRRRGFPCPRAPFRRRRLVSPLGAPLSDALWDPATTSTSSHSATPPPDKDTGGSGGRPMTPPAAFGRPLDDGRARAQLRGDPRVGPVQSHAMPSVQARAIQYKPVPCHPFKPVQYRHPVQTRSG